MNANNKLALGSAQFGTNYGVANTAGRVSIEMADAILRKAKLSGMDTIDTAIAYGDSESVLGGLGVQEWRVVSKLPRVPEECSDVICWVRTQMQESLRRLGLKRMYGLLLHQPRQLVEGVGSDLYAALQSLKDDGLVAKLGVSVYGPAELDEIWPMYSFDMVQAPFNVLDRRLVDSGWALRLKNSGVEVHTRSTFLQGLLLMPADKRPDRFSRWSDLWHIWDRWLFETGLTPLQACLRYAISLSVIDRVIVGVDTVTQLHEIGSAAVGVLDSIPAFNHLHDDRLINPACWSQL
jgi:aryl-alcohol dehydrogenase-like predicted oxidoreductase